MPLQPDTLIDSCTPRWRLLIPPFAEEWRTYTRDKFRRDGLAAATVAMVSIPQAVGFALIAGLTPAMVLTCVIVGGLVASLFFSSRFVVFGPSNSMSLLLASAFVAHGDSGLGPAEMAVVLAFLIGAIQVSAGLFRFGQITQFISRSVVIGYGAAIGALLALGQLDHLLGGTPVRGTSPFAAVGHAVARVLTGEFSVPAVFVAAAAFGVFWLIRRLRPGWPEALLGLVLFSLLAQWLQWDALGVRTLGDGGPLFARPPDFAGVPITLRELATVRGLLGPALAIALLGMLEAVSIAKTYGTRAGEAVDTNRELVAMGFGNLASGCFAGMPGSASFARSAANFQAGAASRWAGALSSAFVLVFVVVLAPLVEHVPVPALAAALVRIGWRMIDREQIRVALRTTGSDAVVLVATFAAAMLLPLDVAIYAGVGLALALALRKASSPTLTEYTFTADAQLTQLDDARQRILPRVAIIHVEGELFFGAADLFQDHIRSRAEREDLRVVILRLKNARHIDVTTVFALRSLHDYFRDSGRHLLISGVHGEMLRVLRRSGLFDLIGRDNLFPAEANPNLATRKALLRARELLQTPEADVRIFLQQPA